MSSRKSKIFNYYFLNKYLHPKSPPGFRENVVVLVNGCTCDPPNKKFLLVQEKNRVWTLPKKGVDSDNLIDGIINAFVQNIGGEMGFRGLVIQEVKPRFEQKAYLINFATQKYDKTRAEYERKKKRPTKGKIYHLVIINYYGPSELPVTKDLAKSFIMDYKWVDYKEGLDLVRLSSSLRREDPESYSKKSIQFNTSLFKKCIRARSIVGKAFSDGVEQQVSMF